jgi:hypothetical protein
MAEIVTLLIIAWFVVWIVQATLPDKPKPRTEKPYPRIVTSDGVWVEEIGDFDVAIVKTSPTTLASMPMEDAKKIAVDAR